MRYCDAILILQNIDKNGHSNNSFKDVEEAIKKILSMETIAAVPKYALRNALAWCFEVVE